MVNNVKDLDFVSREEFSTLVQKFENLSTKIDTNKGQNNSISIIVFSGSLDKLLASFVIATGAQASGMEASVFFTFWGTSAFKKPNPIRTKKGFLEKMFSWLLPKDSKNLQLSQLNMAGLGPHAMRYMMKKKNIVSLEELITVAAELGVKVKICEMSMHLMGIVPEEIRDYPGISFCGVSNFLETASSGKMTLFI